MTDNRSDMLANMYAECLRKNSAEMADVCTIDEFVALHLICGVQMALRIIGKKETQKIILKTINTMKGAIPENG